MLCAAIASRLGNPRADFLLRELRRAGLCAVENLPIGVVALGSRVTYRVDGGMPEIGTLVLPSDLDRSTDNLSVLTDRLSVDRSRSLGSTSVQGECQPSTR